MARIKGKAKRAMGLPETGFLRLKQIIGDKKNQTPALIPVSAVTWWNGVKKGIYPQSVKLGPRTTAWRVEDIRKLIEKLGREG
jgi:predicted DNA-binding transcriptional regulator AlpA